MASSNKQDSAKYWGFLIQEDKSPSPMLTRLLRSIADFIIHKIDPPKIDCLTPQKLARFYRLVGGNYDDFFLNTPHASLSFIYRSIGCYHTLQPVADPYGAPQIPALTPVGYSRWQTLQLLLDPHEHVPFLQAALQRFDLLDPTSGKPFPRDLPRTAFPLMPDPEMTRWHASMAQRLLREAQSPQERTIPQSTPRSTLGNTDESSRPTSADSMSVDSQSLIDAASYFQRPKATNVLPRFISSVSRAAFQTPLRFSQSKQSPGQRPDLHRCNSYPEPRYSAKSPLSNPQSRHDEYQFRMREEPRGRLRTPSSVSTSSCSSTCSSCSTSTGSLSPEPRLSAFSPRPRAGTTPIGGDTIQGQRHPRWSTLGVPMAERVYQTSQASLNQHIRNSDKSRASKSRSRNFRTYLPSFGANRAKSVGDRPHFVAMQSRSFSQAETSGRGWL